MTMGRQADIAWAAGLFEGEGCISRSVQRGGLIRWQLILTSTDRDVLERFRGVLGFGSIYRKHQPVERWKPCYSWILSKHFLIYAVLVMLYPWFGKRRQAKAREALLEIPELRKYAVRA